MKTKNDLLNLGKKLGLNVKLDGIILKKGRLKSKAVAEAKEVLGFDYILYYDGVCYACYIANPPLHGATQPVPTPCLLGLEIIKEYKIDYKEAIKIFHTGNWGGQFTSIELKKPLHPNIKEPYWYFN